MENIKAQDILKSVEESLRHRESLNGRNIDVPSTIRLLDTVRAKLKYAGAEEGIIEVYDKAILLLTRYQTIITDLKACKEDGYTFIEVNFLQEVVDGKVDENRH